MSIKRFKIFSIILLVAIFLLYTISAFKLPIEFAPDEHMRIPISNFIASNGYLPRGDEEVLINTYWGFSYALLPYFPSMLSAIFIKFVTIFTSNVNIILGFTRLVSVLAGTATVYLALKIGGLVFKNHSATLMFGVLVGFLPQYGFLSSYLNNDAFSVFTTFLIFYGWIIGIKTQWNLRSCITLAIGNALCALTYYNAYAFILFSIVVFIISCYNLNERDYKIVLKKGIIIFSIAFLLAGWYFIRNYMLFGDFLGLNTVKEFSEMYGQNKPSVRPTPNSEGLSLKEMLFGSYFNNSWLKSSVFSFIGMFGYMNIVMSSGLYALYILFFSIGGTTGLLILILKWNKSDINHKTIFLSMIFCIIIPIGLSMYNSYYSDFQAQGRYFMSIMLPSMLFVTIGYDSIATKVKEQINIDVNYIIISIYLVLFIVVYTQYIYPMIMHG